MGSSQSYYFNRYASLNINEPSFIMDHIFLGGHWSLSNPDLLSYVGITHVLNLAYELPIGKELKGTKKIKVKHIQALDSENYFLRNDFNEAFNFIDKAKESGGKFKYQAFINPNKLFILII